jgi:hypothetical protein
MVRVCFTALATPIQRIHFGRVPQKCYGLKGPVTAFWELIPMSRHGRADSRASVVLMSECLSERPDLRFRTGMLYNSDWVPHAE